MGSEMCIRDRNDSHEKDRNLNISYKMSRGVLECDVVMLQNYMLMVL